MISFKCPCCNEPLEIDEKFAGKRGKCIKCGALIDAPNIADAPTVLVRKGKPPSNANIPNRRKDG